MDRNDFKNEYRKLQPLAKLALSGKDTSPEAMEALGRCSAMIIMSDFIIPSLDNMGIKMDNFVSERSL